MKTTHKLFFAIPFDSATINLYDRVTRAIRERYPGITTVIGKEEVGPSTTYSEIASFKAQNRELTSQFVAQIQSADIVVADLTHNNANVHVELGIALTQNKNILRVTGRSLTELGFDIRNFEAHQYKDEPQLIGKIFDYLEIFFKIKQLSFSNKYPSLYLQKSESIHLDATSPDKPFNYHAICPPSFKLRDGAVRVNFEILDANTPFDWFGIYFRVGSNPFMGSHLVYVRQNGDIEIAVYPGPVVLEDKLSMGHSISGRQTLTIEFENNHLDVQINEGELHIDKLSHQAFGSVLLATLNTKADVHSVEVICRDTIEWY